VIAGDNVIAVGLHASGANSSDCLFGIQLVATYPHAVLSVQALPNGDVQLRWPCGYKLVTTDTLQTPPTANNWTEVGDTDGERTVTPAANQKRFLRLDSVTERGLTQRAGRKSGLFFGRRTGVPPVSDIK